MPAPKRNPASRPTSAKTTAADAHELVTITLSDINECGEVVKDHVAVQMPLSSVDNFSLAQGLMYQAGRSPYRKKPNVERNENLVRLRDEVLENGKHRTFKEVRTELRKINPTWAFKNDDAVRRQYDRLKGRRR